MPWTKPDFEEITLSGEVTAYVNTDDDRDIVRPKQTESAVALTVAEAREDTA